jgi:hypothetical protein
MHNSPSRRPPRSHPGAAIRLRGAEVQAGQPQQQQQQQEQEEEEEEEEKKEETMLNLKKNAIDSVAAGILLDDLAWWAAILQRARGDNPLPPAALRKMAAAGTASH